MKRFYILTFLFLAFGLPSSNKVKADILRKVVVLGSSTAAGIGAYPADSSWVNRLERKFLNEGGRYEVVNLALGGFSTYDIMPNDFVAPAGRPRCNGEHNVSKAIDLGPSLIIINLPTNDVAYGYSDEETLSNYRAVITLIRNNNIPFLIISTMPRNFPDDFLRLRLKQFNDKLRPLAEGQMVSVYDELANEGNGYKAKYYYDGVHTNNAGHGYIFRRLIMSSFFSSWATSTSTVLDLDQLKLIGKFSGSSVQLKLENIEVSNNFNFVVTKSADGKTFYPLYSGTAPFSTSEKKTTWSASDFEYYKPISYYKIEAFDSDRRVTYSSLVAVRTDFTSLKLSGFRSDAGLCTFDIESPGESIYSIGIFTLSGKSLFQKTVALPSGKTTISTESISGPVVIQLKSSKFGTALFKVLVTN